MENICQRNVPSLKKDRLEFYMYETHKITRFTNFHLTHNSEAIFFNVLIHTIPFRNKNDLLKNPTINEKIIFENVKFMESSQIWTPFKSTYYNTHIATS